MDVNAFKTLKKVLLSTPDEIQAMCPEGYDIDIATRRYRQLDIDEFKRTVGDYVRNARDPQFRGYILQPTTCNHNQCPMYNGNRWSLMFHMHGEAYKVQWLFTLDDHAIDTECGDHSWLEARL